MQLKSVAVAVVFALSLTACSTVNKIVYRIDVPQGNYLEASKVSQVKVGMNAQQVQYLLGTPVLVDPFSNNTWYYVFLNQKAYETPEQHTFVVNFDSRGIVTSADLDKPLPDVEKPEVNNAVINATEGQSKSWWQFWK
ncbi:outer membrane protein assembly factor BamE [Caviibacterium pharyngocola]|uniref:Outer membrane protein assembly factor BamE n=1 Tax=Caviibacterium pharyngocola TaxID=28159 RepID=A0A2M8RYI8_9PAST|nr:outer membrane protein assembly factor BamE [Caviibacterium pharyngocola]PJG83934.1 outer membrane protein assembly factor BamE [Caviibacterium pharyngocola]